MTTEETLVLLSAAAMTYFQQILSMCVCFIVVTKKH